MDTLALYPHVVVRLDCLRCNRKGAYRLARLAARYGAEVDMRFSEAFNLSKQQAQLDFVDIDLETDTPLYVDPFALSIQNDEWSERCTAHIQSFFQSVISAIHNGDERTAKSILTNLSEPNETRLGQSRGRPRGRGVSGKQSFDLYEALADSEAARMGVLSEVAECDLFIEGIGPDKISDITTNVIRSLLVEYTQAQCELHGIQMRRVPSGSSWDATADRWVNRYVDLPVWQGEKIILVPKASVRFRMSLDSQEYYNHFVLNFLQAEHIRAGSALVKTFVSGRRKGEEYVTKKSIKETTPFSKDALYQFTKNNPNVLAEYKAIERRERRGRIEGLDPTFDVSAFCDASINSLNAIPMGREGETDFHNLMIGTLEFLFFPNLIYPRKETPINESRKRIDITYTNAAKGGFFYRLHTSRQIACNKVMVECKNYSRELGNPEIDQLAGRFSVNRGKFGILVARSCADTDLMTRRCRDVASAGNGFPIVLFDEDIIYMLRAVKEHQGSRIDRLLDDRLSDIL